MSTHVLLEERYTKSISVRLLTPGATSESSASDSEEVGRIFLIKLPVYLKK
jgi:hypothetical protein